MPFRFVLPIERIETVKNTANCKSAYFIYKIRTQRTIDKFCQADPADIAFANNNGFESTSEIKLAHFACDILSRISLHHVVVSGSLRH